MIKLKKLTTLTLLMAVLLLCIPAGAHYHSSVGAGTDSCAVVDASGNLWTWGYNLYDCLGYKTERNYNATPQVAMQNVASVECKYGTTYVIKTDNTLWKFGGNTETGKEPVMIADNVKQISLVGGIPLILKLDGTLIAKGTDYCGAFGKFNANGIKYENYVTLMTGVSFVSGGSESVAVIKNDGSLWFWGTYGMVNHKSYRPMGKILDDVIDVSLHSGSEKHAAVKADGSLWIWSGNEMPKKVDENVIDACDGECAYIKNDNSLWVKNVQLRYTDESGKRINLNDKNVATKVLDNVVGLSAGPFFGLYDDNDFYLISMTDGSVRVALVDLQENDHGVLGLGDKEIPRGTAFHTPLYATAKVLEKNQISAGGYIECPFNDVKKGDYFYEPVVWAVENGVTNGINKNTFSPSLQCTRGQVMTFLCRATENAYGNSEVSFNDVGEADYFYNAVKWAVSNEITKGTSETTFSPNELCTSAQIITFIWRANGSKRVSAKGTIAENYDNSVYYKYAVAWADSMGILEGTQKSFSPDEPAMRCDVLTYIYRTVNK